MDSAASRSIASSRGSTPRKAGGLVRACSECLEQKPKDDFPVRQWERKNRRCFNCLSGNVDFSYTPETGAVPVKSNNLEERFDMCASVLDDETAISGGRLGENNKQVTPPPLPADRSKPSPSTHGRQAEHTSVQRKSLTKVRTESKNKAEKGLPDARLALKSRNRFPLRKVPQGDNDNSGETANSSVEARNRGIELAENQGNHGKAWQSQPTKIPTRKVPVGSIPTVEADKTADQGKDFESRPTQIPFRRQPRVEQKDSHEAVTLSGEARKDVGESLEEVDQNANDDSKRRSQVPHRKVAMKGNEKSGQALMSSPASSRHDSLESSEEGHKVCPVPYSDSNDEIQARFGQPDLESYDGPPTRDQAPESLPADESSSSGDGRTTRCSCCCWDLLLLAAAPLIDEKGSIASVFAGIFTLSVIGSTIGAVSHKNPSLPTVWYQYVSAMIGYVYFICWSISFYPQVISNFRRRSTGGLSADFCVLNVIGFGAYTAYNASMFWSSAIRDLYREKYHSEVTVQSNDVAFALHALVLSTVTLIQIMYYGGSERPSKIIVLIVVLTLALCAAFPVVVLYYKMYSWLDYLYVLSYVKIAISLIKYMPQVILNHRRKSTAGWSIWNILLDFMGGLLSDLQLVCDCWVVNDFSGITGNLAKFGLGFVSMFFDISFMTQHYILYPESARETGEPGRPETEPLLSERERNPEHTIGDGDERV